MRAVLVSGNQHKLDELSAVLPRWELELLDADDAPVETGSTYYANARAKAGFGRAIAPPEAWVLGEDSGIEVEGLGGFPGVRSARWSDDPVTALLAELAGVSGPGRRARYVSELVALSPEGEERRGTGTLTGRIADTARGSEGFGYDPIFVPDGKNRTVAELGNRWKSQHSHRARAAAALVEAISGGRGR